MKKLYIIAAALLAIATGACNKDNSTAGDHPLPEVKVAGLQTSYSVYTRQDILRINPEVQDESRYDFFWTAFTTNFVQGNAPRPDTLARTKNLEYEVMLNPGQYILVFNVRDKKTSVTKLINMNMIVATLNMNGWYLLKENGSNTDLDFIHKDGRIDNWMAFYNNGKSLEGKPLEAVFAPNFKMSVASTELFGALALVSDKDAAIIRVDNGKIMRTFDDMFFTKPAVRKPQSTFQPMNSFNLGLVNDGKSYCMNKGGLFAECAPVPYQISRITAVGAMDIGFDEKTKSIFFFNGLYFNSLPTTGNDLKNMNADLIWINGYAGSRSVAMALFRDATGAGTLFKLNTSYPSLTNGSGSAPLVTAKQPLPVAHGLMKASAIGGNYDADYIYYAVGNNIYMTDIAGLQENLQVSLPAGEAVTCIQHIKFPQPGTGVVNTLDFIAIASFSNGRYKVWLHKPSSTGTIQPLAKPDFEGEGRVSTVIYMENGLGSRVF